VPSRALIHCVAAFTAHNPAHKCTSN
jgi:hypothetical protein